MRKLEFLVSSLVCALYPKVYLLSPHMHLQLLVVCQRWTCECQSQEWLQGKCGRILVLTDTELLLSPQKVQSSHMLSIKGQSEVWLIPIGVNRELNNPLILIWQHTLLMMIEAMKIPFQGEMSFQQKGGVGGCNWTALPELCCSPC